MRGLHGKLSPRENQCRPRLRRRQSESMVIRTRRQAMSPVAKFHHVLGRFHDSAGDIDFYQMSLSQLESTILHESIILLNIYCN